MPHPVPGSRVVLKMPLEGSPFHLAMLKRPTITIIALPEFGKEYIVENVIQCKCCTEPHITLVGLPIAHEFGREMTIPFIHYWTEIKSEQTMKPEEVDNLLTNVLKTD